MRRLLCVAMIFAALLAIPADVEAQKKTKPKDDDAALVVGGAGAAVFVGVLICSGLFGFLLYFLPLIVAMMRSHPDVLPIAAVNFLFGWTFVGWGIALVWALKDPAPVHRTVVNIQSAPGAEPIVGGNPFEDLR
jgi:hypothetical protein